MTRTRALRRSAGRKAMRNKWIAAPYVGWMAVFVAAPLLVVLVYALTGRRRTAAGT